MENNWYYAEASDRSYGPVTVEDLGRVLRAKANSVDFLVWCPGMAEWGKAGEQFALRRYFQPPPIPSYNHGAATGQLVIDRDDRPILVEEEPSSLHPWRRYFARMFDLYFFFLFFFFFLGIALPRLFDNSDKSLDALYAIFGTGAYAIFEGLCLNVFGSSLGKRLYGIKLTRSDKDGFTLAVSFKRSFAVWARGLGIGIPIVSLVTLIVAYRTLTQEKQTSWDRDFQCITTHNKLSALRWISIVLVWLLVLAIYIFLIALADGKA
ncbi:RDD family protein [Bradyrhizobium sp. AZCC 1693]|uniref:RDD family protein n=1 Tax=Bradyrhizobium sp. AZCC 1693 TaxID=3117029 RepID=UPI002FF0A475